MLQQYTSDVIEKMLSSISLATSMLTNRKTRDLIMILNSKRFLDKLVATLEEKQHREVKLKESLKDLDAKRMELQNTLSSSWPKQDLVPKLMEGLTTVSFHMKWQDCRTRNTYLPFKRLYQIMNL